MTWNQALFYLIRDPASILHSSSLHARWDQSKQPNLIYFLYSHFHNDWFFLAKKENIMVPNAVEKSRTSAFWSQDQMLIFCFRLKKKQSLWKWEYSVGYIVRFLRTISNTYFPHNFPILWAILMVFLHRKIAQSTSLQHVITTLLWHV